MDKEAPEEFFGPYLMDRIEATKKARAENPDKTIAVAFAMYTKAHRDFVRKHTPEPVTFVEVSVKDKAEVAARRMPRMKAFCESAGKTEAEGWVMLGFDKKHGPFKGPQSWEDLFTEKNPFNGFRSALGKDDKDVFFVDSGHMSAGTVPGLEKALGLPHIENPDI